MFFVTDHDDKNRVDPIIDSFATRDEAQRLAAQWSFDNDGASCNIEEFASIEDARG